MLQSREPKGQEAFDLPHVIDGIGSELGQGRELLGKAGVRTQIPSQTPFFLSPPYFAGQERSD